MQKILVVLILAAVIFCVVFIAGAVIVKASDRVINITGLKSGALVCDGFELNQRGEIDVLAVGARASYSDKFFAYGWIINADNRDVVWTMQEDCRNTDEISKTLRECEEKIRLDAGKYEVYYFVGGVNMIFGGEIDISIEDLGDLIKMFGDAFGLDEVKKTALEEGDLEELMLTIRTDVSATRYTPTFNPPENNVVYINRPANDELHDQGFTLKKKTALNIYAIGEFSSSYELFVDGAWIIDADSREKVWTMDKWNTERAGGSTKNRYFRDVITLPAGNYVAYYATDDSHTFDSWNSPPPADPNNYGLSISAAERASLDYIAPFSDKGQFTDIVKMVKIGNDEFRRQGFQLKEDARLHILAYGERSFSRDRLADYAWITDVDDMDKVWELTADNSQFAGGDAKNCAYDGTIELPAGNYMVYYRSDDSHSFEKWNAAPPFDQKNYGITVSGVGPDFHKDMFVLTDEFQPSGNVLVNLTGIGDDASVSRSFKLDKTTAVRITALGEGKADKMYDYAWIERGDNHEVIWEMTYRKTRHAGGATKNRIAVANLTLEKGEYVVHFLTDDSHSFEDFNASPPDNPEQWGVIITQR